MGKHNLDLLVIAPSSARLYQNLQARFSAIEPNIWAGMLAASARTKGRSVELYDLEVCRPSPEAFASEISNFSARVILFVVTGQNPNASSAAMDGATYAASLIDPHPSHRIAFTGPHVNALPLETLERHAFIDIVFTNEGVYALDALLSNGHGNSLSNIPGIAWRDGEEIKLNSPSPIVPQERLHIDLPGIAYDLMPPLSSYRTSPWHANFVEEDRSPFASIYTSLGCIFKCDFCMINIINRTSNDENLTSADYNTFRYWNPDHVATQLDYLADNGVVQLKIADEMWVLRPQHFLTLCDLMIERDYGFNIWAYARVNTIKERYLDKLKRAGVSWLAIGIESGNQVVRQEVSKGKFQDVDIVDIINLVRQYDINVGANYIFGLEGDTWDTMNDTLNLALDLNTENANFYCATALPGSPTYQALPVTDNRIAKEYSEYGFLSYDHVPNSTTTLRPNDILAFRDYAFHTYFESPRYLNLIERKFGMSSRKNIEQMTSIKLKRRLLDD